MNDNSRIIAIIPARGGSRGIPRKNVQLLGDRPLVAWSIEAALKCPGVDRVIVSTDDEEIADISRAFGAEVPFLRPAGLSRDDSLIGDVENHVIAELEARGYHVGGYLSLYPTHPFRTRDMLDKAADAVRRGHHFKTVRPIPVKPGQYVKRLANGMLSPITPVNAQLHFGAFYRPYGLINAFARDRVAFGQVFYPVTEPIALIDIDTPEDLARARAVLEQWPHA